MPLRIVNAEVTVALHAKKCVAARWNRLYWTNSGITTCLIYLLFTTIHYALSYHSVLAYKFTSFSVLKNLIATCSPIIAYFLWLKLLLLLTFTDSIPFFLSVLWGMSYAHHVMPTSRIGATPAPPQATIGATLWSMLSTPLKFLASMTILDALRR